MDQLRTAIRTCPIIDNHAHNLLLPSEVRNVPLLSITSEAQDGALQAATSTLAHIRAVRQLAKVLYCQSEWDQVKACIERARGRPDDAWSKQCFQGIATVLIDDGLDKDTVHPVSWHDRLTPYPCKRIVRIEVLAQDIFTAYYQQHRQRISASKWIWMFQDQMRSMLKDPKVVGFKSIICYRTGLDVPGIPDVPATELDKYISGVPLDRLRRLQDERLNPLFVNVAARVIQQHDGPAKPFQFHTGLGDNDIALRKSSASYLQPLIEQHPGVKFVILHASYPFTREAGYLASVYPNCYLDIGEVFPMVSQDGQAQVIRQALELCPSEKLCWSTDGHWFPETYLLAVLQVREALEKVLGDYLNSDAFTAQHAVECAENILYNTSNRLYSLGLPPLQADRAPTDPTMISHIADDDVTTLTQFVRKNPDVRYLHLQLVDYASIRRGRVVPVKRALEMLRARKYLGIQRGAFRMLPNDSMPPETVHQGEWAIKPCIESLRGTPQPDMAAMMCELQNKDGSELSHDPRTILRRVLAKAESTKSLKFTIGYEIEVIFMKVNHTSEGAVFSTTNLSDGHCWSGAAQVESKRAVSLIRDIMAALESAGVELEQYHAEAAKSQYEFILAPRPAMAAVEQLIAARAAIASAADAHELRATLVPKIAGQGFGTGAHMHISLQPEKDYEHFYAGVLQHMRGILAFAMSAQPSFERMGDGTWSGGTWVCWGDQNRESCLRRIEGSHWECKVVDGLAHPYLVVAALVGAGLHGVAEKMELKGGNVETNPGDLTKEERAKLGVTDRLPSSVEEALKALQEDDYLCSVLGADAIKTFVDVKRTEAKLLAGMEKEERQNWLVARY